MKEGVTEEKRERCLRRISEAFAEQQINQEVVEKGHVIENTLPYTSHVRVDEESGLVFDGLVRSTINFSNESSNAYGDMHLEDLFQMKGA